MVFSEDENPNRYTFYKWIDLDRKEKLTDQETDSNSSVVVYRVASVTFSEFGEEYTYICEDESIRKTILWLYLLESTTSKRLFHVVKIFPGFAKDISYPIDS